jgi:hypothetical protein
MTASLRTRGLQRAWSSGMRTPERPDGTTPRRGEHACHLYGPGAQDHSVAARFIASGLSSGERCLYVSAHSDVSAIVDALENEGVDVADQVAFGALRLTTAARTYLRHGTFSPGSFIASIEAAVAESRADGYVGLRATEEMGWAAADAGQDLVARYESDLARTFAAGGLTGLCQYDRADLSPELLEKIRALHPVLIQTGSREAAAPHENDREMPAAYAAAGAD